LYLTDTGRRWDGDEVSVRDKVFRKEVRRLEGETISDGDKVGETEVAPVESPSGCSSWSNSTSVLSAGATGQAGPGYRNAEFAPVKYASLLSAQISRGNRVGGLRFCSTWNIIEAADKGLLPDKIMINAHPQRWDDKPWPWVKEFVGQNVKNVVKKYFFVSRRARRVHGDTAG